MQQSMVHGENFHRPEERSSGFQLQLQKQFYFNLLNILLRM